MAKTFALSGVVLFILFLEPAAVRADESGTTRYGLFNLLDHRSTYGEGWFPEPLRATEMDVDNELRVDWLHTEKRGEVADAVTAEIEKSFGLLTLEIEVPYERESESEIDPLTGIKSRGVHDGIGAVEVSARHPVVQWVSEDQKLDFTLVAALEVAIPTGSQVGRDGELVPQLMGLLRLGEHLSVQTSGGYSTLIGPEESGKQTLEYSVVAGWAIEQQDLPLPRFIDRVVPEVELIGERGLNNQDFANVLTGTVGTRINLNSVGPVQPRLGFGYVFPMNQDARDELRWGVISSFVLEY